MKEALDKTLSQKKESTKEKRDQNVNFFINYLKENSFKITKQRLFVIEKILELDTHFTCRCLSELFLDDETRNET